MGKSNKKISTQKKTNNVVQANLIIETKTVPLKDMKIENNEINKIKSSLFGDKFKTKLFNILKNIFLLFIVPFIQWGYSKLIEYNENEAVKQLTYYYETIVFDEIPNSGGKIYATHFTHEYPQLLEKIENTEKNKDAYNFFKGVFLIESGMTLKETPDFYFKQINPSSIYYNNSIQELVNYYIMEFKADKGIQEFKRKINGLLIEMEQNKSINITYYYICYYKQILETATVDMLYEQYKTIQMKLRFDNDPIYNITPNLKLSHEMDKDLLIKEASYMIKITGIQYLYFREILNLDTQSDNEKKIQAEIVPYLDNFDTSILDRNVPYMEYMTSQNIAPVFNGLWYLSRRIPLDELLLEIKRMKQKYNR